jgi:hypothetical protein
MTTPKAAGGCPVCGDPKDPKYRPFCSRRCADIDLGRWMTDRYAIPVVEPDETDDAPDDVRGDD